jgi:hypothetical protein
VSAPPPFWSFPRAAFSSEAHGDVVQLRQVLADAQTVSERDSGRLWARRLYGELLLIDAHTGSAFAIEPDAERLRARARMALDDGSAGQSGLADQNRPARRRPKPAAPGRPARTSAPFTG